MKKRQLNLKPDRVTAFSDGVFAIIITLMILNIHIPTIDKNAPSSQIWRQLFSTIPSLIAYTVSFFSLAIFWLNHHNFFHLIKHIDSALLWLNMILLFCLSLIPLPTSFIAEHYGKPEATAFYSLVMFMCNGMFGIMFLYAKQKNLFIEKVNTDRISLILKQIIIACILWVIAIFVGYISVYLSYLIYTCIVLIFVFPENIEVEED